VKPVTLGTWTLSTGNSCDLLYRGADAPQPATIAWDRWPLTAAEASEYLARIRPPIVARILEYTERTHQRVLVLTQL